MRVVVDGRPLEFESGDSLLVALLRADLHPTGGGCLCSAGDCPHCLVAVDGVSYVRACQTIAAPGMLVERQHLEGRTPPLLRTDDADRRAEPSTTPARHVFCDVVVIGQGESGLRVAEEARAAGREVVTLEAREGQEVVGIYPGPLVVARSDGETLQVHVAEEIVVATGAAEIQPVAPGGHLEGLLTARAAGELASAGLDLGRVVALGKPPSGVEAKSVEGELVRFDGEERVEAVVVVKPGGVEERHECDSVSLGLGLQPRSTLTRMAQGLPVRAVGDAALEPDLPACPRAGTLCPCSGVEVADLQSVWDRGFRELELVKRATLAGTGTCQGSVCVPHLRSFLLDRGKELQPPFTARPVARQPTLGEIASGAFHRPTPRTPLHDEHVRLGAQMERSGGWWRPWSYGDERSEYAAVREGVSLGDVSTLGKFLVSGPDALAFLEKLYPTQVSTLRIGRSRYVLLLDERGYVLDDGLVCRDAETRYTLSLTSAGSTFGELWLRDWADAGGYDVRILNQTMSLGAINVTGPASPALLAAAGVAKLPGFARHGRARVAGVDCRVYRLSFTGELSYELHHHAAESIALWRRLLELGDNLGIRPHGLETLLNLRLEKGHIVVGQDTDYDSTARRIHHDWMVKLEQADFVGRQAVLRTDKVELDRQLVGFEMESPAPLEGSVIYRGDRWVGNVTSSTDSQVLGKAVMLGWLDFVEGELPEAVEIEGRSARRVALPFYDPDSERARAKVRIDPSDVRTVEAEPVVVTESSRFQRLEATRVVASRAALDELERVEGSTALRIASDEALVLGPLDPRAVPDEHAIVERETGFSSLWASGAEAAALLARTCDWRLPSERPVLAQGALAGVPAKLWFEDDRVLFVVPAPLAHELEERLW